MMETVEKGGRPGVNQESGRRWTISARIALGVVIVMGLALRWIGLGRDSLWMDEGYTWWVMRLGPEAMVNALRNDVGSPLLYMLMRGWAGQFGQSEFAMRSLHAVCASAALLIFVLLAQRLLRRPWAIVAAAGWFAVAFLPVSHAREARYYAIVLLAMVVGLYALVNQLQRPRWTWLGLLATSGIAGLYTHNVMGVYWIALNVVLLIFPAKQRYGRRVIEMLVVNAVVIAAFLPWVGVVIDQMRWMGVHFWASRPDGWKFWEVLTTLVGGPWWMTTRLLHMESLSAVATPAVAVWLTLGLAGVLVVSGLWTSLSARRKNADDGTEQRGDWRIVIGLLVLALLPVVAIFIKSLVAKPMFLERLFIASSVPIGLLLVWTMDRGKSRVAITLATIAFVGICEIAAFASLTQVESASVEDWRSAYNYLAERPAGRRLIVFVTSEAQLPFDYYAWRDPLLRLADAERDGLPLGYFATDPPQNVRKVSGLADTRRLCAALRDGAYDEVDLVLSHASYVDPDRLGMTVADACGKRFDTWVSDDGRIEIVRYHPRLD